MQLLPVHSKTINAFYLHFTSMFISIGQYLKYILIGATLNFSCVGYKPYILNEIRVQVT